MGEVSQNNNWPNFDGSRALSTPTLHTAMKARPTAGFIGGTIGSLLIVAIMLILFAVQGTTPMFMATYTSAIGAGGPLAAGLVGGLLFVLSGAVWGALFAALVPNPTVLKGIGFGLVPALWLWVVVAPLMLGQPLFFGFAAPKIIMPFIFNCIVWGSATGWHARRHAQPSAALA